MEYQIEELLPVVSRLTDKYTSKESTSVTYETARVIMEAVIYCIEENTGGKDNGIRTEQDLPAAQVMYDRGYEIVIGKVYEAKAIYDKITADFEDYGCLNYRVTILEGMPAFFLRYDPKFKPQDHLLTLDYPVINRTPDLCGVNLILTYLKGIEAEQKFLDCFEREAVIRLLESIVPDYQELYLDNICEVVLERCILCAVAESPVKQLELQTDDYEIVSEYFRDKSREKIEVQIIRLISMITQPLQIDPEYFTRAAADYAFRIHSVLEGQKES